MCFSIGASLLYIYNKKDTYNYRLIGYAFMTVVIVTYFFIRSYGIDQIGNLQMFVVIAVFPMAILCILFIPWVNNILQWRPFLILGSISTEIYLLHFPVQCLIRVLDEYLGLNLNYSLKRIWILYVAIVIIASVAYKKLFDKTYRKLLKKALLGREIQVIS